MNHVISNEGQVVVIHFDGVHVEHLLQLINNKTARSLRSIRQQNLEKKPHVRSSSKARTESQKFDTENKRRQQRCTHLVDVVCGHFVDVEDVRVLPHGLQRVPFNLDLVWMLERLRQELT